MNFTFSPQAVDAIFFGLQTLRASSECALAELQNQLNKPPQEEKDGAGTEVGVQGQLAL
jgi:hypothetical protein